MSGLPAAFLDRDGVINEDHGYVHRPEEFALLPGVERALKRLRKAGFLLILVTNQSGVARGYFTEEAVSALHDHLAQLLAQQEVAFDGIYHCPHHPDGKVARYARHCACRKPQPGMLLQAIADLGIDPARSFIVGDKQSDLEAGEAAGLGAGYLVGTEADFLDLASVVDALVK